ncbi:uncharacterized protein LOC109803214 isoform X2 [Cajanus cajan]|uniref:uncharacterized protein LOC109803214 isoform X2 n=1 Tax=Cajanus cajan TaxID=3821 RepID=UPI0010FB55F4|nr:uncharacterized protein LOC109803214 isoform X2 [Cajanus cajan]
MLVLVLLVVRLTYGKKCWHEGGRCSMNFIRESCNLGMGTQVEYSINLLASSVDSNNFIVGGVDIWEHYQNKGVSNNHCNIGVNKLQNPMDRMFDRNNMESIKKTMQIHEDIFKHQVRELHRVYNVQKMLMEDLRKETKQKKFWTPMNGIHISHPHFLQQQQQQQTTLISYGHVQSLREDQCSKERSGSCSGETMKRQRGFDLERPTERDIFGGCDETEAGPSSNNALQRCKISNGASNEDMEVDLTLSIGGSQVKKNNNKKPYLLPLGCSDSPNGKTRELNSSLSFQSDRVGDCSDPTTPMSSSSVTFDQERKGPHWLSQGLKLK